MSWYKLSPEAQEYNADQDWVDRKAEEAERHAKEREAHYAALELMQKASRITGPEPIGQSGSMIDRLLEASKIVDRKTDKTKARRLKIVKKRKESKGT